MNSKNNQHFIDIHSYQWNISLWRDELIKKWAKEKAQDIVWKL